MLAEAAIALPSNLIFVPLDFEHQTLADGLAEAGFDFQKPAFFGWLGVVPYLTLDAFRATLSVMAQMPAGSGVSFDYAVAPGDAEPHRRGSHSTGCRNASQQPESRSGSSSRRKTWRRRLRRAGFQRIEQVDSDGLNDLYFQNRADGLKLSPLGLGMLATAWV